MDAVLALEDGLVFRGRGFGAKTSACGESVFNTSMTGYQEILTDPSYKGQIVTMTYPEIGNTGINPEDVESSHPWVEGFIVREAWGPPSNWRNVESLDAYLRRYHVCGLAGIDTRALTRRLRSAGVMRAVIATGEASAGALVERARRIPQMEGLDLASGVTCAAPFDWRGDEPQPDGRAPAAEFVLPARRASRALRVAAYDFGIKRNILRRLAAHGCEVRVFPAAAPAADLRALEPDGIFLSNGPGDPAAVRYAIENVRQLLEANLPVFGICLGHQILALALGGRTFKLKFGHRGSNHPVRNLATGAVEITAQNHGFAVDPASLPRDVELTHVSLYDGTVEGFRQRGRPVFSVQYHPEASPGPHDADYLFDEFLVAMESR